MSKTTSPDEKRTALEVSQGLSMALLLAIDAKIQAEAATADGPALEDLVKLGQRASDLLAECRKLEKAQGQLAQGITRELVLAWLKQQDRTMRQRIMEDLIVMNDKKAKGSVLG